MKIAILGTGKMGGAMARRLAASGFELIVWNRTATRAADLSVGTVAATPAEATRDADMVISSLTNDTAVRDVYLGEHGVLGAAEDTVLIDTSTAGPEVIDALGREAAARRAHLLSAPVLGILVLHAPIAYPLGIALLVTVVAAATTRIVARPGDSWLREP
jgi:3-hydroxyisobutyrate dehydrogenase-like beta-hydroxyacid dehydrogenase